MITPAISVLSAVEGLKVATPAFRPFIIPITVVILVGFPVQRRGTAASGAVFGPVMLVWFASWPCSASAASSQPGVLAALDPRYA